MARAPDVRLSMEGGSVTRAKPVRDSDRCRSCGHTRVAHAIPGGPCLPIYCPCTGFKRINNRRPATVDGDRRKDFGGAM